MCSMTQSKVKVTSTSKLEIQLFSKAISSAIYNGNWQLTNDSQTKFYPAGFLIFGLVFMSLDFEVGRNVSCKESTVSPVQG